MNKALKMLAFDFGASSGRAILGIYDGDTLTLQEVHRFSNDPVEIRGRLHWDILRLFHEIKQGILHCANSGHRDLDAMAVDTWGVDFGLLDERGNLLGNPYHYRDSRTDGMPEKVFEIIPEAELYGKTGIQLMRLNTIFQLFSMKYDGSSQLDQAKTLLLIPDLFNYFLTGAKVSEYSIASTTQLLEPGKEAWSMEIIRRLGLPEEIFTRLVPAGTIIGTLSTEIARELGCGEIPVVATAAHDTQSAVVSVPTDAQDYVYISCGTWSLVGVELEKPRVDELSRTLAFTNEGGVGGKTTFLKNIMGLWLIQECKRQWEREGESLSFAGLESMAREAEPFVSFIDPDHASFMAPGDMPNKIQEFCRCTGQPVPEGKGGIVRCIAQSLALKYRLTVESLEDMLGKQLPVIHMVGGGIKDQLLCQFTAEATGRGVIAGPVEATSVGNLMVQAMALGAVKGLSEARQVVHRSFPVKLYQPQNQEAWTAAYVRFRRLVE